MGSEMCIRDRLNISYFELPDDCVGVIRAIVEPRYKEGVRCQDPVTYSPTRFVCPRHWSESDQEWPSHLYNLKYIKKKAIFDKTDISRIINDINKYYYKDEELLDLVKFFTAYGGKFMIRSEEKSPK